MCFILAIEVLSSFLRPDIIIMIIIIIVSQTYLHLLV